MNCAEVQDLLSTYHDGELPRATAEAIELHCARCAACAAELGTIRKLSALAKRLQDPRAPGLMWSQLAERLAVPATPSQRPLPRRRLLAAAVFVFLVAALGIWGYRRATDPHRELARNFSAFLAEIERRPTSRGSLLADRYSGKSISPAEAKNALPYNPVATNLAPAGCSLEGVYLMKLPCCECIQTVFRRADGGRLDVFEHDDDQSHWFGDRPCVRTASGVLETKITQLNDGLAATWRVDHHYLTAVGARDLNEVIQLAQELPAESVPAR